VSAPSQVGKTSLGEVAAARWLVCAPQDFLAFLSYGQDLADVKSAAIRDDVRSLGLELREDTTAKNLWRTAKGGGLLARGLSGGITGQSGLVLLDVDDPYRNRMEAESAAHKRRILADVRATVFSRINPRTSVIIKHTRYAADDLIGVMERDHGDVFESYRIPAVDEAGQPVVSMGGRDAAFWAAQRKLLGEHDWWSLMMGLPRPREGRLFRGVATYTVPPGEGRHAHGVDFAYSTRAAADYSTIVTLTRTDHRVYVRDVVRVQEPAPSFAQRIAAARARRPGPCRAYIGGTERGTVDFLASSGVPIQALPATGDKWSRAQACAAAWNAGDIMLPESAPWLDAFVGEVLDFAPAGSAHDDQVDALVAAFDALAVSVGEAQVAPAYAPTMLGMPRTHGRRGPW
jgi:predicted phage terminase large subunit-like protein